MQSMDAAGLPNYIALQNLYALNENERLLWLNLFSVFSD
jgi:hypothetical protein